MLRLATSLLLLAALTGCSTLGVAPRTGPEATAALIAQDRYDAAFAAAGEETSLRQKVQSAADSYQRKMLAASSAAQKRGEYAIAIATLDTALDNYDSDPLREARTAAHAQRERVAQQINAERQLNSYRHLRETRRLAGINDSLERTDSGNSYHTRQTDRKLQALRPALLAASLQMLAQEKLTLAEQLVDAATQLGEDAESRVIIARISSEKAKRTVKQSAPESQPGKASKPAPSRTPETEARERFSALLSAARSSFLRKELLDARINLTSALSISGDNPEAKRLLNQVQSAITQQIDKLLEEANQLYRLGKFAQAKKNWTEVLALAPDHAEAQVNLQRTERVLSNLDKMKKKQP